MQKSILYIAIGHGRISEVFLREGFHSVGGITVESLIRLKATPDVGTHHLW